MCKNSAAINPQADVARVQSIIESRLGKKREIKERQKTLLLEFLAFHKPEERLDKPSTSKDLSAIVELLLIRTGHVHMQMHAKSAIAATAVDRRVFTAVRYKKMGGNSASE